jgi:hypothetical protein
VVVIAMRASPSSGLIRWLLIYVAAYILGAGLDLGTTIAATSSGIAEGNVYTLQNGAYVAARALGINVAGLIVMLSLWGLGVARAGSVAPRWLDHPFASWEKLYFNPFTRAVADRAPLHLVAWAAGFVIFRILAAMNNAMLMAGLPGPIGWTIFAMTPKMGQTASFILIVAVWYIALTVLCSPIAAAVMRRRRRELGVEESA